MFVNKNKGRIKRYAINSLKDKLADRIAHQLDPFLSVIILTTEIMRGDQDKIKMVLNS